MSPLVQDPRWELTPLVDQGKAILQEAATLAHDARTANPKVSAGVNLLDWVFDLSGYKRGATAAGRVLAWGNLAARSRSLSASFDVWYQGVLGTLRRISIARNNITLHGNSGELVRRVARARTFKRLDTQIAKATGALEAIAAENLVYNTEIPELFASRRRERMEARRRAREMELLDLSHVAPGMELVRLTNREGLRSGFARHPEVGRMIEGALDAYGSTGADANRQALASCRSAVELLVREKTGEQDWRTGLARLAAGSRKRLVSDTYAFLSGYGSHPGGTPTKKDAAYGIRMTVASCLWLMEGGTAQST